MEETVESYAGNEYYDKYFQLDPPTYHKLMHGAIADIQYITAEMSEDKLGKALFLAAYYDRVPAATAILENPNTPIDYRFNGDFTPLSIASTNNCPNVLQLLLDRGANYLVETGDGENPLHLAAGSIQSGTEALEILIGLPLIDTIINARDAGLDTPLHKAVEMHRVEAVRLLLTRNSVDVNALNGDRDTPLDMADDLISPILRQRGARNKEDIESNDMECDECNMCCDMCGVEAQ